MAHYLRIGEIPPKRHTQWRVDSGPRAGQLHYEEVMGEEGFSSDASLLYHLGVPSAIVDSEVWELPDLQTVANHPLTPRHLKLHDLFQAPDVSWNIARQLPGNDWYARDWTRTHGNLYQAIGMEKTMIGLLLLLIVAVAAFNIVSTLVMVVTDKKSDIAILRTLGATPRQIMAVFMVQGTFIGVIGTAIGCLLGVLAALNVSAALAWVQRVTGHQFLNAEVYFIDYLPAQLQLHDVLLVCGASFALSFLATLYPSWSAARTQPAEALRYE